MTYKYNNIEVVHLEITDKCNATCPMCARNKNGGAVNQHLPLTELSVKDIEQMFPIEFIKQLKRVYMCGNYGDPIAAKETLEIFKYFRQHNEEITLGMHTNGSAKKEDWWAELATVIGKYGYVTFGIDGLAATNHLYRKSTNFAKIMANVKSYISAGGRARWDFIVFNHNEHQIEEAEELSKTMGFEKFTIKKTGRFFSNVKLAVRGERDVMKKDGTVDYVIKPPTNENYQNKSLQKEAAIIEKFGSMSEYLDQTEIKCITKEEGSIYISADGYVFPCCWTANQVYVWWKKLEEGEIWQHINKVGGTNAINAKTLKIQEIVDGPFFQSIERSWSCDSVTAGKLEICSRVCGQNFNQFKDQYK